MQVVSITRSYYASLCFRALRELGLQGGEANPAYASWAREMNQLGEEFAFKAPIAGGPVFTLVYQIPAYLSPQSTDELNEVGTCTKAFIRNRSIAPFAEHWPERVKHWSKWYTPGWFSYLFSRIEGREEQVCLLVDRFLTFLAQLWPDYLADYENGLSQYPYEELDSRCKELQVFSAWENELGAPYPYDEFKLVICPESTTVASSLGPEKIAFSHRYPWEIMRHAIFHEVGVRFMNLHQLATHPETAPIMLTDYHAIVKLIEVEVCHRKRNLMPELGDDMFVRGMQLENLMRWRSEQQEREAIPASFAAWYPDAKKRGLL